MDFEEHLKMHDLCISNYKAIKKSKMAGCFSCCEIFPASEVNDWIDEKKGSSAICPKCEADTVLPDSKVTLTKELLVEMQKYWSEDDV